MTQSMNSKLRSLGFIPFLLLLWVSLASSVSARSVEERWFRKLDAAERNLRAQKWDAAYRKAEKVSRDVMRLLEGGTRAEELLARIFVIQAVAEAGRGNERLAHWNWDAALELHPPMEKLRLDSYGEAGRLLLEDPAERAMEDSPYEDLLEDMPTEGIELPCRTVETLPDFPRGRWVKGKIGMIIMQLVIDKEGQAWEPNVLKDSDEPLMAFATLRAAREWKFKPAKLDGKPVGVYYNFTTVFGRRKKEDHGDGEG